MSLKELQEIERDAVRFSNQAEMSEQAIATISADRKSSRTLSQTVCSAGKDWNFGQRELAKKVLFEVLDEMKVDIMRIAELRLDAMAREAKVHAAQRRAVITASILPLPDIGGGQ